jgi:hypothetical protein
MHQNISQRNFVYQHIINRLLLTRFLISTQDKKRENLKKAHYPIWIFYEKDGIKNNLMQIFQIVVYP